MKKAVSTLCLLGFVIAAFPMVGNAQRNDAARRLDKVLTSQVVQVHHEKEIALAEAEKATEGLKKLQIKYPKYAKELSRLASYHQELLKTCENANAQQMLPTIESLVDSLSSFMIETVSAEDYKQVADVTHDLLYHQYYLKARGLKTIDELLFWSQQQLGVAKY